MGAHLGLYETVEFSKITKESTDLHNNKLHPQRYLQGDGHTYLHTHILTHIKSIFRDKLTLLRSLIKNWEYVVLSRV